MATDAQRISTLFRQGFSADAIAAILDTDLSTVHGLALGSGTLPGGGSGVSNIVYETDVPDQTITLAAASVPQDVSDLWRIDGPGLWAVAGWYEIKPFDDNDYAGVGLLASTDLGPDQLASSGGPDARAFTNPNEALAGGWIRQHFGSPFADLLTPTNWREYRLQAVGFHYHDDDPGDTTTPVLGDVQIRNVRAIAVRLDG